jgi:hypothetical protein
MLLLCTGAGLFVKGLLLGIIPYPRMWDSNRLTDEVAPLLALLREVANPYQDLIREILRSTLRMTLCQNCGRPGSGLETQPNQ